MPLRMTADQPVLIKATLYMLFVNERSQHQKLAREYLEASLACIRPEVAACLYRDAEPVEQEGYAHSIDLLQEEIDALEQKLSDSTTTIEPIELNTLRDQLAEKKLELDLISTYEQRYLVSPEDLEAYHNYGDCLYFQPPSIFDPSTEEGRNVRQLRDSFSTGNLTVEQFIARLDEMTWILEMEDSGFIIK